MRKEQCWKMAVGWVQPGLQQGHPLIGRVAVSPVFVPYRIDSHPGSPPTPAEKLFYRRLTILWRLASLGHPSPCTSGPFPFRSTCRTAIPLATFLLTTVFHQPALCTISSQSAVQNPLLIVFVVILYSPPHALPRSSRIISHPILFPPALPHWSN